MFRDEARVLGDAPSPFAVQGRDSAGQQEGAIDATGHLSQGARKHKGSVSPFATSATAPAQPERKGDSGIVGLVKSKAKSLGERFIDFVDKYEYENGYRRFDKVSERLRDDKEFVAAAVKREPGAIAHASERLRDDRALVKAAIEKDPEAFRYASARLRDDKTLARAAIENNPDIFRLCSDRLRSDPSFAKFAVEIDSRNFQHVSDKLKKDREFIEFAVGKDPSLAGHSILSEVRETRAPAGPATAERERTHARSAPEAAREPTSDPKTAGHRALDEDLKRQLDGMTRRATEIANTCEKEVAIARATVRQPTPEPAMEVAVERSREIALER